MQSKYIPFAVTMGDPAGCGPEALASALTSPEFDPSNRLICVGERQVMERAFQAIGKQYLIRVITRPEEYKPVEGTLHVLDLHNVDHQRHRYGELQASAGHAAYEYITTGIELALEGRVSAVVTGPISKEALHLAGHAYDGHTEIFATLTSSKNVTMMLASGHFRVTHVSTHVPLHQAIERCKSQRILDVLKLTEEGLRRIGIQKPHLAVAGLNPHCGEGGIFGTEEMDQIQPAIDQACQDGLNVYAQPIAPDTVFVRMLENKEFDAVVAQYHDQGHIAAKIVDFWGGVNITLGLPIIRTSVDHGTAFDIVGKGTTNPKSMLNAIAYAKLIVGSAR